MPTSARRCAPALLVVLSTAGCSISLRVDPAVTLDTHGKVGGQALAGVGLSTIGPDRTGSFGVAAGYRGAGGEPHGAVIIEDFFDFILTPHGDEEGLSGRAGARLGIRPSFYPDGEHTMFGAGVAMAGLYRFGKKTQHFIGLELRCDLVTPFASSGPPTSGVCATGPHYQAEIPFLGSR